MDKPALALTLLLATATLLALLTLLNTTPQTPPKINISPNGTLAIVP